MEFRSSALNQTNYILGVDYEYTSMYILIAYSTLGIIQYIHYVDTLYFYRCMYYIINFTRK